MSNDNKLTKKEKQELQKIKVDRMLSEAQQLSAKGFPDLENLPDTTIETRNLSEKQKRLAVLYASRAFHELTFPQQMEIANISYGYGYQTLKLPEFKRYVEQIQDEQMKGFLGNVYHELQDLIKNSKSEKVRLDSIKVFLQMAGKMDTNSTITHISKKETPTLDIIEAEVVELEQEMLEDIEYYLPEEEDI